MRESKPVFFSDEAKGYNYSIYLMVGMPYLLMAVFGLIIYRKVRAAQAKIQAEERDISRESTSTGPAGLAAEGG